MKPRFCVLHHLVHEREVGFISVQATFVQPKTLLNDTAKPLSITY